MNKEIISHPFWPHDSQTGPTEIGVLPHSGVTGAPVGPTEIGILPGVGGSGVGGHATKLVPAVYVPPRPPVGVEAGRGEVLTRPFSRKDGVMASAGGLVSAGNDHLEGLETLGAEAEYRYAYLSLGNVRLDWAKRIYNSPEIGAFMIVPKDLVKLWSNVPLGLPAPGETTGNFLLQNSQATPKA